MTELTFTVPGIPQPQGSKRHVGNGRMIESAKGLAAWRTMVRRYSENHAAGNRWRTTETAVHVCLAFTFPRPGYHYGTGRNADTVKAQYADAMHTTKPDIDKLVRGCLDAMTGVVFRDDSQVVAVTATKAYGTPGVAVRVVAA